MSITHIVKGIAIPPRPPRVAPLNDLEAWDLWQHSYPHIFDRMWIARVQGVPAHPHGIVPPVGDWISKPIVNLEGMGMGVRPFSQWTPDLYQPGHFWMRRFGGRHRSEDYVMKNGSPLWRYVVDCEVDANGTFWQFKGHPSPDWDVTVGSWVSTFLTGYTGALNVELSEDFIQKEAPDGRMVEVSTERIVEVHLRPNPDFLALYGQGWLEALERLYVEGVWEFSGQAQAGVVIPIRVAKEQGTAFQVDLNVPPALDCLYVHLDFIPGESVIYEPNDTWTYRLAVVGDPDEGKANAAAEVLAQAITAVQGRQAVARMTDQPAHTP